MNFQAAPEHAERRLMWCGLRVVATLLKGAMRLKGSQEEPVEVTVGAPRERIGLLGGTAAPGWQELKQSKLGAVCASPLSGTCDRWGRISRRAGRFSHTCGNSAAWALGGG